MFLKPYEIKCYQLLRRTDSKRLRLRIEALFPHLNAQQLQQLFPASENVSKSRLSTYSKYKTCVFYIRKRPMFFEIGDNTLVPTLYAVRLVPDILPYFTTFPNVLTKLLNGSHLTLQNIAPLGPEMNMYGNYNEGQIVAINLTSSDVAVGVGFLTQSSDHLNNAVSNRKVAVRMLHFVGDELWANVPEVKPSAKSADLPNLSPNLPREVSPALSPESILRNAFLAALRNNGKTMHLPLLVSKFYRTYVVPEAQERIDLKKTLYKKLSNFLKEMMDQRFLSVREETEGLSTIVAINLKHPELVKLKTKRAMLTADLEQTEPLFSSKLPEYLVAEKVAQFFTKLGYKSGNGLSKEKIKEIVNKYTCIHSNNLMYLCLQEVCESSNTSSSKIFDLIIEKINVSCKIRNAKDIRKNPVIQISLARSKGHTVTRIKNIECYGIIMQTFVKLCKKGAASNLAMVKLPSEKHNLLQIQGNQIQFIYNLLTKTYRLPRKCICTKYTFKAKYQQNRYRIIKRHKKKLLRIIHEKEKFIVDGKYDPRKHLYKIMPLLSEEIMPCNVMKDVIFRKMYKRCTFGDFLVPPLRCEPEKVALPTESKRNQTKPKTKKKSKGQAKPRPKEK